MLRKANSEVAARYPGLIGINLQWLFIATWNDVAPFTGDITKRLTFQSIMATDGFFSFAIFYYNKIEFSDGFAGHAKVGFDLGDGEQVSLVEGSCTESIINITQQSNFEQPGKFVFRIDTFNISASNCDDSAYEDGNQKLLAIPSVITDIAQTTVAFRGPCFPIDANITCTYDTIFDGIKSVQGFVKLHDFNITMAYCQSPFFYGYGRYTVQILVETTDQSSTYEAHLTVVKPSLKLAINVVDNVNAFRRNLRINKFIQFSWDPDQFGTNTDLELGIVQMNGEAEIYEQVFHTLMSVSNTGTFSFNLNDEIMEGASLVDKSMFSFFLRIPSRGELSRVQSIFREMASRWIILITETLSRLACSALLGEVVTDVLPCPCTRRLAEADCNFQDDGQSPEDLDDYHQGAVVSFRQTGFNSFINGAGSQCVYDPNGEFMGDPPNGGTADKYSPDGCSSVTDGLKCVNVLLHVLHDVLPYHVCKFVDELETYFEYRPPGECTNTVGCRPAQGNGDPHITTFDLFQYTFNGNGEFILVQDVFNDDFEVQARMEQLGSFEATVFTAFAIRHLDTVIQIQKSTGIQHKADILVDGFSIEQDISVAESLATQSFGPIFVRAIEHDWSIVSISLTSGLSFRISTFDSAMAIISSAATNFQNISRLCGLLGDYDTNPENDLKTPDGTVLSSQANLSQIHWDFGMKWIVDNAEDSLFHYPPGKSFEDYYKPSFVPKFDLPDPASMPQEALDICGNSFGCLFDYEATGRDLTFANTTALQNKVFNDILTVDTPTCPSFSDDLENGYFTLSNGYFAGSVASFYCNSGYELVGTSSITCDETTFQWSGEVPTCQESTTTPTTIVNFGPFLLIFAALCIPLVAVFLYCFEPMAPF